MSLDEFQVRTLVDFKVTLYGKQQIIRKGSIGIVVNAFLTEYQVNFKDFGITVLIQRDKVEQVVPVQSFEIDEKKQTEIPTCFYDAFRI